MNRARRARRHAKEQGAARARIEGAGRDERTGLLQRPEVGAVLLLHGEHVLERTAVADEGDATTVPVDAITAAPAKKFRRVVLESVAWAIGLSVV